MYLPTHLTIYLRHKSCHGLSLSRESFMTNDNNEDNNNKKTIVWGHHRLSLPYPDYSLLISTIFIL